MIPEVFLLTIIGHATYIVTGEQVSVYKKGGEAMEKVYDSYGTLYGYVDGGTIYDDNYRVAGYTDGSVLYNQYRTPLGYADGGTIYTMGGIPAGYYNGYRLYDTYGNYMGYGNYGFSGLLGAALLFLLLRPFFSPYSYY